MASTRVSELGADRFAGAELISPHGGELIAPHGRSIDVYMAAAAEADLYTYMYIACVQLR